MNSTDATEATIESLRDQVAEYKSLCKSQRKQIDALYELRNQLQAKITELEMNVEAERNATEFVESHFS